MTTVLESPTPRIDKATAGSLGQTMRRHGLTAPFTVLVRGRRVDVVFANELDMASADLVEQVLIEGMQLRPAVLRVDLTAVTFLDSWCLGKIVKAWRAVVSVGARFELSPADERIERVLGVTGIRAAIGQTGAKRPVAPTSSGVSVSTGGRSRRGSGR